MGYFIHMAVNPKPITDVGNDPAARNWVALHQSGFLMVSHGLQIPSDTSNQPTRLSDGSYKASNWATPRWGWKGATVGFYDPDVGRQVIVTEWDPSKLGGYVFESYGQLWPFGAETPVAATGYTGAPFGLFPHRPDLGPRLGPWNSVYNCFQMHSANGLQLGNGGWPDGFGWFLSLEGIIVDWGGPVQTLQSPNPSSYGPSYVSGTIGTGTNCTRDFWVDPGNSGNYFILYDNGWITWNPAGPQYASIVSPQPVGDNLSRPPTAPMLASRWMHVEPTEGWIIAMNVTGTVWGYQMSDTIPPGLGVKPPPAVPLSPPWLNGSNGLGPGGGYWQFGDIVPGRDPSRFYIISWGGNAIGAAITGSIANLLPGFNAGTGTTPTETTRPTLTWSYNETYNVSEKSYSVRVYPQAYLDSLANATPPIPFVNGQNAGAVWISDRNNSPVVHSPGTGSDKINRDLDNGVVYAAYVRATSAANINSTWAGPLPFTMSIPAPNPPTTPSLLVITPSGGYPGIKTVQITTNALSGPEIAAGVRHQFQVSAEGAPWSDVFLGTSTQAAVLIDPYPPTNVRLRYRVRSFKRVPGLVPSAWVEATHVPDYPIVVTPPSNQPQGWRFIDPWSSGPTVVTLNVEAWSMERTEPRGEFQPLTVDAMIVTSGGVKGTIHTLTVRVLSSTEYRLLWDILSTGHPLILQNVFGRQWWVRATPGTWAMLRAAPTLGENTGIRDAHTVSLRLVEVKPTLPPGT